MNFNNYTIKSQEAIQQAQQIAQSMEHQQIENEHLFKGLWTVDEKVSGGEIMFSREAGKTINEASIIAKKMNDEFVSIEHLILAIFKSKSKIAQILKDQGITETTLNAAIQELRKGDRVTSQSQEETYNSLSKYAKNLNQLAKDGKLDPVIGRDEEIRRILQILSRRTKNNPILVGEPGTGKTAIAEGLAHRIIDGDVFKESTERAIRFWTQLERFDFRPQKRSLNIIKSMGNSGLYKNVTVNRKQEMQVIKALAGYCSVIMEKPLKSIKTLLEVI